MLSDDNPCKYHFVYTCRKAEQAEKILSSSSTRFIRLDEPAKLVTSSLCAGTDCDSLVTQLGLSQDWQMKAHSVSDGETNVLLVQS
jgi:hypothetical protein